MAEGLSLILDFSLARKTLSIFYKQSLDEYSIDVKITAGHT